MSMQPQPHAQAETQAQAPSSPHSTTLTIRDSDLAHSLRTLRNKPTAELSAIRTLRVVFTEANLLYWHGSLWPERLRSAFDADDLDEYAKLYPQPPAAGSSSSPPPSEAFRALLRFVAEICDLGNLDLEVDASSAPWSLFQDKGAGAYGGDEVDDDWRFVYEFYLDVGRALAEVFAPGTPAGKPLLLRHLSIKTSIWDGMGDWLVAQTSGRGDTVAAAGGLPRYHETGMRLLL